MDTVIENAMRYNKPGTPYYKAAQRIKSNSATALAELNNLRTSAPSELISDNGMVANAHPRHDISTIGDLEPPFVLLDLLDSPDIADELNIVLHSNPLQFLLAYELPEAKPPPPPPLQPILHPRKNKRERKAETGKRRTEQRAPLVPLATFSAQADSEMVDVSSFDPHIRIPAHSPAKVVDKDPVSAMIEVTTGASSGLGDSPEAEQILGKRKRAKPAHSHPSTDAEVLTDINPKASFALFDKGWILDPGVRRGGRARTDRPPPPLMKKRSKGECICRDCVIQPREVSLTPSVVIKGGGPVTTMAEPGQVGAEPMQHTSPVATVPSTVSGTSEDFQPIEVQPDTISQDIPNDTGALPPETDESTTFAANNNRFLAGPGVIPVQGAMTILQAIDQGQDNGTPPVRVALSDDRDFVAMDELPPEEQGDSQSQIRTTYTLLTRSAELQDVVHGEPTVEVHIEAIHNAEASVSIPPPSNDQPTSSLTLAEAKLKFKLEPNMTLSQDPDGKLVIQELDSPVTRREKAMRRKRARSQLVASVVNTSSTLDGSDLSSLSSLSEDDDGNVRVKQKIDKMESKTPQPGQVVLEDGRMLEGGTLGATNFFACRQ